MKPPILRALVVEDDPSWGELTSEIIRECGLEVDRAGDFDEAVAALKSQPHRLAVVDLSLAPNDHNNQDGLRVLTAMRQLDPNCRAILLTGFATVELAVAALNDYGAFTFLRKENFQRTQFRDIISRLLVEPPHSSATDHPSASQANSSMGVGEKSFAISIENALVVDDDAGWRSILEELLTEMGYRVRVSSGFGEALGYLRKERFNLAILDLSLRSDSHASGDQLLAAAAEYGIPTIVVSGNNDEAEIQRIYTQYSIAAYIEKQAFNRAAFHRILEETQQTIQSMSDLNTLTEREREVLDLLAQGLTNKQIADRLVITTNTVKRHLKAIFEKLDVHTRSAAAAKLTSPGNFKTG